MKKIHIVAHTHWDKEWYFTVQDSLVLCDQIVTNVIDELLINPLAKFCIDGQTSVLEDYLKINPHRTEDIRLLTSQKRLEIGPWFTQTDCLYVNGESIIRNLYYGIYQSKLYGDYMRVAYLPDTFGFNCQMPTIIKSFDMNNFIFRRGFHIEKSGDSYFKWKGLGNKSVNTIHLLDGYGAANRISSDDEYLKSRIYPYLQKMEIFSKSDNILMCSGGDQTDIIKDLNKILDSINNKSTAKFINSTYEEFFDQIEEYFTEEYSGDMRVSKYDRVHRTVGSVRTDIKQLNSKIEKKLLNRIEPLVAIGSVMGINISPQLVYSAWKLIMESQAHDAMAGCVTDEVHKQIIARMIQADEICDGIENLVKNKIAASLGLGEGQIILFNTSLEKFSGHKKVMFLAPSKDYKVEGVKSYSYINSKYYEGKKDLLIEEPTGDIYINEDPYYAINADIECEIPAMGYKVFEIVESTIAKEEQKVEYIENEFYKIYFDIVPKIIIKESGKSIENFISFVDTGNDGDTYDFSPLRNDKMVEINLDSAKFSKYNNISTAVFTSSCNLPKDLKERLSGINSTVNKIKVAISLNSSDKISCSVSIDNQSLSHRLQVKLGMNDQKINTYSSVPFGIINNNIIIEPESDITFSEVMVDAKVLDELVSLEASHTTSYIATNSFKEYFVENNELLLTCFSSTGEFGKPNLLYRPGRASGDTTKKGHVMIPTPNAQLIGNLEYSFIYCLTTSKFTEKKAVEILNYHNMCDISYQRQSLNKFINRLDNKIQDGCCDVNICTTIIENYATFSIS